MKRESLEVSKTSHILHYLKLFPSGNVVNKPDHGTLDWVKICEKSSKVITFIDLAGHERYLKTTVFGMTGHAPDFGMLMVRFLGYYFRIWYHYGQVTTSVQREKDRE